jgi:molecular chaperone GrpE
MRLLKMIFNNYNDKIDMNKEKVDKTEFHEDSEGLTENDNTSDTMSDSCDCPDNEKSLTPEENDDTSNDNVQPKELSFEEKYNTLNDSYLRLMAEYDNYRKRTLKEKADLIKNGGVTVLTNILPVVDDFERALDTLTKTDESSSVIEGIKLIYDKFISYLAQQGVKKIETIGQPFDTEKLEAIATIPAPEESMKGKVIDCVQNGYMMYDKVLRFAKVVVGE